MVIQRRPHHYVDSLTVTFYADCKHRIAYLGGMGVAPRCFLDVWMKGIQIFEQADLKKMIKHGSFRESTVGVGFNNFQLT